MEVSDIYSPEEKTNYEESQFYVTNTDSWTDKRQTAQAMQYTNPDYSDIDLMTDLTGNNFFENVKRDNQDRLEDLIDTKYPDPYNYDFNQRKDNEMNNDQNDQLENKNMLFTIAGFGALVYIGYSIFKK